MLRAYKAGVLLVTGSDPGNMLALHGPTVHRELQLWVQAGIPPQAALHAATYNAAKLLRADKRIGLIRKGMRRISWWWTATRCRIFPPPNAFQLSSLKASVSIARDCSSSSSHSYRRAVIGSTRLARMAGM